MQPVNAATVADHPVARRADMPGALELTAEDDVTRSAALLTAVGFQLVPLAHPVAGVWDLLAVSPRGLTLIAARPEKPNLMGATYGPLPGWPAVTVRLILVWPEADPLPTAITL
jgi:hypothetical protein